MKDKVSTNKKEKIILPSPLRGLFLDFDGTLVDSMPSLWRSYQLFLEQQGITGRYEDFCELIGASLSEIVHKLIVTYKLLGSFEELTSCYQKLFKQIYAQECQFFPHDQDQI